jgi:TetR/AcrR family transcriptional repressor of nem operon
VTDADVARGGVQVRGTKEALIAEAAQADFGDLDQLLAEFDTAHCDHDTARDALLDFYRSTEHRDQPGTGCPTAGFAIPLTRPRRGRSCRRRSWSPPTLTAPRGS